MECQIFPDDPPGARPVVSQRGGALLEVVVALALLAVVTLPVAAALDTAVRTLESARALRRALSAVEGMAALRTVAGPVGPWAPVDPVAGDPHHPGPGAACSRRHAATSDASGAWLWVEVSCHPDGLARIAAGGPPSVAQVVRVAVPR